MDSPRLKNEGWLYGLAFLIALGLRLIQLGASPLTDSEATFAIQALRIAQGAAPLLGPQPAYIHFTSILFAITESTNFMARLIPALVGSALVFVPSFFREKIKPHPALILAFLFAFDPGLVALSRMANGTILAGTFLLFACGMWIHRRTIPAGIFAGLALLSGPSLWAGLLTLGLTWVFIKGMESKPAEDQLPIPNYPDEYRPFLLALISTLLLIGTLFFLSPNGLSAGLASIPAYLSGWFTPTVSTPDRTFLTFLAYEPLGIMLAGFAILRGLRTKSKHSLPLMIWCGVSLLLAIFYRQAGELVWAILPLLTLGALELSRGFDISRDERVEIGIVVTAILILLAYTWFNIANIALNPLGQLSTTVPILGEIQNPRFIVLFGSLAIVVVCITLVAIGWSARTARLGTIWSFTVFFGLYSLAAAWGASGIRNPNGVELWNSDSKPLQADLLTASVDDVSEFSLGHTQSQPVTVVGIDSPALEWLLRNHQVKGVSTLDPQVAPPMVIT
ncbi:MAG TPA: hypothetical protein VJ022_02990, partial [Anaerolineales bacterium]|nr:hypothetical protein [Anaerolineales bacterium]